MLKINRNYSVRRIILTSLVFGSVWGAVEALLGQVLHAGAKVMNLPNLPGFFLFPIALLLMTAAYRNCGSARAILGMTAVAAAMKAASLFLPGVSVPDVRNPVIAILSEGVMVAAGLGFLKNGIGELKRAYGAVILSVGWRALFLLSAALSGSGGILRKGPAMIAGFLAVESVVNGLLVAGIFHIGPVQEYLLKSGKSPPTIIRAAIAVFMGLIISLVFAG